MEQFGHLHGFVILKLFFDTVMAIVIHSDYSYFQGPFICLLYHTSISYIHNFFVYCVTH